MSVPRRLWLVLALVATLVLSFMDFREPEPGVAEPARAARRVDAQAVLSPPGVPAPVTAASSGLHGQRGRFAAEGGDLFAARSWAPPPAAVASAPAALPVAPPLPFRFQGKMLEDGQVVAFVSQGAFTHLLHKGDVVSGYRVDDITPLEMTLVYLPLNEKQRLIFGSAN